MLEVFPFRYQTHESKSVPELELLGFISSVTELLGSDQTNILTEIWLDELASTDAMPEPTSVQWRLVTLGAWARLSQRLLDICINGDCARGRV